MGEYYQIMNKLTELKKYPEKNTAEIEGLTGLLDYMFEQSLLYG